MLLKNRPVSNCIAYCLFAASLLSSSIVHAQTGFPYQVIKLEKPSDYTETEPLALQAAGFLLATPFAEQDNDRSNALTFLTSWVTGAKSYNFYMQGVMEDLTADKNLLSLYLAAMVKFSLENKKTAENPMTAEHNACAILLKYCDDPKNNFRLKKKYRKLLEAK